MSVMRVPKPNQIHPRNGPVTPLRAVAMLLARGALRLIQRQEHSPFLNENRNPGTHSIPLWIVRSLGYQSS
jgi:hypothetical protein